MSKEKELLKRCLEKTDVDFDEELANEIEALLAEPEEEPIYIVGLGWQCDGDLLKNGTKLYTSPPNRDPLSEGMLMTLAVVEEFLLFCNEDEFIDIARAIEKAHGIGE